LFIGRIVKPNDVFFWSTLKPVPDICFNGVVSTTDENGKARATIREIASAAGVSIATVSRVLNERPGVAAETRGAVLRVVRDHGFTANRSARALSGGRTGLIGVMLPIIAAPYFASILSGASEALYEQDMRMVLCPTLHHHEREVTLLERLMQGTTDGAVLMLPEESNAELKVLHRKGYAFVIVDPRVALDEGIPAVSAANASGARAVTEHLLSLGHRRIGAITGPRAYLASSERLSGYEGALAAAGVLPDPGIILESTFDIEGGAKAASRLLDAAEPPTAIFAFNDNNAIGALRVARERGIRVPEELSIAGFDDSEMSAIVTPPLTTVRQPLAEMGRMAVSLLIRILENQRLEALHIELQTRLIVRASTARVRES
jgi:LacI family transcriptional regulator